MSTGSGYYWVTLHSIMFLLIPMAVTGKIDRKYTLHSIMFLLILKSRSVLRIVIYPLHSIMFLLIPHPTNESPDFTRTFTFHNVSINTFLTRIKKAGYKVFTFHNVSINTGIEHDDLVTPINFTFHNVSINTETGSIPLREILPLHSIMFLLIQLSKEICRQ